MTSGLSLANKVQFLFGIALLFQNSELLFQPTNNDPNSQSFCSNPWNCCSLYDFSRYINMLSMVVFSLPDTF